MEVTKVSETVLSDPAALLTIAGMTVGFALLVFVCYTYMVVHPLNDDGSLTDEVKKNRLWITIAFPLLIPMFASLSLLGHPVAVFESTVTSVSDPADIRMGRYGSERVMLVNVKDSEYPFYVRYEPGIEDAVKEINGQEAAFLCTYVAPISEDTKPLLCDVLQDKPGSESLEKFKAEGLGTAVQ